MVKATLTTDFDMANSENKKLNISLFGLLLAAAAIPIFMVKIPALGDFLNHLARVHIIASVEQNPYLAMFYEIKWDIVANIGMDLVAPFFTKFFDIYLVGKIFVFLALVFITTGIYAIHYSIYRHISLAPLLAFLFLYNHVLLIGFINYLLGLGIALWAIAFWIGIREYHPVLRFLVSLAFTLSLFLCHLYAVGLYGFTVACYEIWRLKETKATNARNMVADTVVLAVPFIIVLLLLMGGPTGELGNEIAWKPFHAKFRAIEWVFGLYHTYIDRMIGALIAGASLWALGKGIFRIHPVGWIVLILGVFLYILMPNRLFDSVDADLRLPIAIIFIFIAFTYWKLPNFSYRAIFIAGVIFLVVLRIAGVGKVWIAHDRTYAEFRKSFTYVEPGSKLLTVIARPPNWLYKKALPLNFTNCLAVIDRSVFTPDLFAKEGQQPLSLKSKYRELKDNKPFFYYLSELTEDDKNHGKNSNNSHYWSRWKGEYDYLLILYTRNDDGNPLPNRLEIEYQGKDFQLYSIKPSA